MQMVRRTTTAPVVDEEDTKHVKALVLKNELTKITAAGKGAVALATFTPSPGSDDEIQKGELMKGLIDYIREKIDGLVKGGKIEGVENQGSTTKTPRVPKLKLKTLLLKPWMFFQVKRATTALGTVANLSQLPWVS